MRDALPVNLIPFGLLELDATGTVLLYEPVKEWKSNLTPKSVTGLNFFTEIVPFSQVRELQYRFDTFISNGVAEERFTLSLPYNHGQVRVRFLLARLSKQARRGLERMAIVQIAPENERLVEPVL
ncbi:MAG: hypothetical protein M3458_24305 [Acidobacteriota bacterium]|nr:hypothetical protein [Acidobacteriota bacterium]